MNFRNILFLLGLGLSSAPAWAQQPAAAPVAPAATTTAPALPGTTAPKGNGKVTGTVVDATTGEPIAFATVALLNTADNKPVDGTMCDEKGRFSLTRIAEGEYRLAVSFLGYENKTLELINIAASGGEVNVGTIQLVAAVKNLKEVEVVGMKDLVEDKVDRVVYNAEKDITNTGGTAADVLQKVPLLSVDMDGNVQLRGSSNVRVLINNKPSSIMASSIADALRQIPADMIKSVEVITSPSARYDAEGTAGIINIITKKNTLQGVNGSVNLTGGNRNSNANTSVNIRRGKLGINTGLGSNLWMGHGESQSTRADFISAEQTNLLQQNGRNRNRGLSTWGNLGFDYDLSKKDVLAGSIRFSNGNWRNSNFLHTVYRDTLEQQYDRDILNRNNNFGFDANLDYTHTFKPQQELAVLGLYSRNNRDSRYDLEQFPLLNLPPGNYLEKGINESMNEEITFQADYTQPLRNKSLLEAGAKGILRNVSSDYQILADPGAKGEFIPLPARSNVFSYDQNVASSYLSYAFRVKEKNNIKAGLRYEHTFISGDFISSDTAISNNYGNLLPSLSVSHTLKDRSTIKFNYSRRIQRPQIFFLNPYVNISDPRNISYGNPNLDAELTDSYEVGYNTFIKSATINVSLYWRQTNNAIENVRYVNSITGVSESTYRNIARNKTYGMSIFGNVSPLKNWNLSGTVNVYRTALSSAMLGTSNESWVGNMNLNSSWLLGNGYSAQFFGNVNTPRVQLQGKTSSWRFYSMGMKKELFNKKGSLTVNADNIFGRTLTFRSNFNTENASQSGSSYFYNRAFRVSFSYNFGKLEPNKQPRRRRSIRNDDAKQGDGGGGGM